MDKKTEEAIFNTPCRRRCRDCCYLVEGRNGEWLCTDFDYDDGKDIEQIADDDCSLNIEI